MKKSKNTYSHHSKRCDLLTMGNNNVNPEYETDIMNKDEK